MMFLKISENSYLAISTITQIDVHCTNNSNKNHLRIHTHDEQYVVLEESAEFSIIMKFVEQSTFTGTVPYPSVYTNQPERQLQTEAMVLYKDKDNNVR
jgi:hypothetical protein